jgi:hypothetical protein
VGVGLNLAEELTEDCHSCNFRETIPSEPKHNCFVSIQNPTPPIRCHVSCTQDTGVASIDASTTDVNSDSLQAKTPDKDHRRVGRISLVTPPGTPSRFGVSLASEKFRKLRRTETDYSCGSPPIAKKRKLEIACLKFSRSRTLEEQGKLVLVFTPAVVAVSPCP